MSKQQPGSAASKIRSVSIEFFKQNVGKTFRRKQLEDYINNKIDVTSGEVTGCLNQLLLKKGVQNGIFQQGRGVFLYDPTKKADTQDPTPTISEQLQEIMDLAFKQVETVLSTIQVIDYLSKDDLDKLANFHELLKMKERIDEILKD